MTTSFTNTEATREQLYAQEANDPFLILLDLDHPRFIDTQNNPYTVRLVANTENILSNGETYYAVSMEVVLPTDDGKRDPMAEISVENIDRDLIDQLRNVTTPITVTLKMVFASDPSIVEYQYEDLQLVSVTYDSSKIIAKLLYNDILNQTFPSYTYNPTEFPGMF